MTARPVRPINLIAYGATDMLGAGAIGVISGWILFFYTTFCGLTALQAATIFTVARIIDAVASPIIGHISDQFGRTRLGRKYGRRRFFLLAALPLLPTFALMWVNGQSFLYYLATYVFFDFIYATVLIPYETLASEMTTDYKTKAKFAGARLLFGQVSAILAGVLPGRIVEHFGKNDPHTFLYLGMIFSALFVLVVFVTWRFSWERPHEELEPEPARTLGATLGGLFLNLLSTLRIRTFRLHLGMYLGGYVALDVFNVVFPYFVVFALGGSLVIASNLVGLGAAGQLIGVIAAMALCLRIQPAPTYRLAIGVYGAGVLALWALYLLRPDHQQAWLLGVMIAAGVGRGAIAYIPWNLYNYMGDVDEVVTGRRRDGALAGVMTFTRKAAQALAVMIVGLILDQGGFVSGAPAQSAGAQLTIVTLLIGGTLLVMSLGLLVSLRFPLDAQSHAILSQEVGRLRDGRGADTPTEHRAVLERLTGWPFERLWGGGAGR